MEAGGGRIMSNCCGEPLSTHHCPRELRHLETKLAMAEARIIELQSMDTKDAQKNAQLEDTIVSLSCYLNKMIGWAELLQQYNKDSGAGVGLGFDIVAAKKAWNECMSARLAALGQEEPCQCGSPILRWVHQQPPKECGKP